MKPLLEGYWNPEAEYSKVWSLTAVVADRRRQQIITLPPKKQLGADKQTSCDKQLAADKQLGADKQTKTS